jgi:hypothetical protein
MRTTPIPLPLTLVSSLLAAGFFGSALAQAPPRPPSSLVAAAFAAYRSDVDGGRAALSLPPNGTLGEVMTLGTGAHATGPIFTLVAARLIVIASACLYNADESPRSFQCVVQVRRAGGVAQNVSFATHESLGRAENRTVTLTTGFAVTPGTYDVALLCGSGAANLGGKVSAADLTVIAVAP